MVSEGLLMILVFFLELAVGGAFSLLWMPEAKKVGAGFYRMMAGVYALCALVALGACFLAGKSSALAEHTLLSGRLLSAPVPIILAAFVSAVLSCAGFLLVQLHSLRAWVWGVLAALGLLSLVDLSPLLVPGGAGDSIRILQGASLAVSAVSLGAVLSAMLLGHWYLVTPTLSLKPLKNLVILTGLSLLAQTALLIAGLWTASRGADADLVKLIVFRPSFDALCFWVRVLVGLLGGTVLTALTWRTLDRWKQTQAATGILYVAVIAVFIGEATGRYLLATKQLPL